MQNKKIIVENKNALKVLTTCPCSSLSEDEISEGQTVRKKMREKRYKMTFIETTLKRKQVSIYFGIT